jgi:hypothetical protein
METTVPLPDPTGGESEHTAVLRDPKARTVRQKRPLTMLYSMLGQERLNEIVNARAEFEAPEDATPEQQQAAEAATEAAVHALGLSEQEWDLLFRTTDAAIYSLLASWTLPAPLPANVAEVADLPEAVYNAIAAAAAKVESDHVLAEGFDVGSAQEPDSPTGASAGSED